jgi:hypothetical protein
MKNAEEIDALLDRLDELLKLDAKGDAIDRTLACAPRITAGTWLRQHAAVQKFREEATRGMIETDTARHALGIVRTILDSLVTP